MAEEKKWNVDVQATPNAFRLNVTESFTATVVQFSPEDAWSFRNLSGLLAEVKRDIRETEEAIDMAPYPGPGMGAF